MRANVLPGRPVAAVRPRLETEIAQLISRKRGMPEAQYEAELEKLFIELAKVNRAIKQGAVPATEE